MEPVVQVTFLPYGKKIHVPQETNLLKAANLIGIYLNSVCGGVGACGKCVVTIQKGEVRTASILKEEPRVGTQVLACQTEVLEDIVVDVPRSSVVEEGETEKILADSLEFSSPEECPCHAGPDGTATIGPTLTHKIYLEMPPPTLDDTTADLERFVKGLRVHIGDMEAHIGLGGLRSLATVLRQGAWNVTATLTQSDALTDVLQVEPGDTRGRQYGVAVDIGTTTVVAELVDLTTWKSLGTQASHNLQIGYGEDVISRIVFACTLGGLKTLQDSVVETVNRLLHALCTDAGIYPRDITAMVCAGNTTMTHLLLGLPPCHIRKEPYIPVANQYPPVLAKEIGVSVNPNGIVLCIPGVSSYVGGDITAGVLFTDMTESEELTLFMDLGTNGEMVLGNRDWLTCCSASVGPAFEGGGIRWGMRATSGAIERVSLNGTGDDLHYKTIGGKRPKGICGSGLIDILGTLFLHGIIDQQGRFFPERAGRSWRKRNGSSEFVIARADEGAVGEDITITQEDIINVIRSKGAVFAAVMTMLKSTGISVGEIQRVLVAGGFGTYLDIEKAILIGLVPELPMERFRFVGNSSLKGSRRALLCRNYLKKATEIARSMTYLELSVYPKYMEEYIAALFLPHTDIEAFPNVKRKLNELMCPKSVM
jgi:uncharacterized 2Fe-2S/4Fe-4S cluster protein (DUF4445 family)